jgi:hypothetical protein
MVMGLEETVTYLSRCATWVETLQAEREMSRMKDVIAEITAENLELKKTLSG